MKQNTNHRRGLVPVLLAATALTAIALTACAEDGRAELRNISESTIDEPDAAENAMTSTAGCAYPRWNEDFLPDSRHIPRV